MGGSRNGEVAHERRDRAAVRADSIEKQGLLLMPLVTLFELFQGFAHRPQGGRKRLYIFQQSDAFEIAHDFMAIKDRIDVSQGPMEKGSEIVFLFAGGGGRNDIGPDLSRQRSQAARGFRSARGLPRSETTRSGTSWQDRQSVRRGCRGMDGAIERRPTAVSASRNSGPESVGRRRCRRAPRPHRSGAGAGSERRKRRGAIAAEVARRPRTVR